jgi:hypothetical protein
MGACPRGGSGRSLFSPPAVPQQHAAPIAGQTVRELFSFGSRNFVIRESLYLFDCQHSLLGDKWHRQKLNSCWLRGTLKRR